MQIAERTAAEGKLADKSFHVREMISFVESHTRARCASRAFIIAIEQVSPGSNTSFVNKPKTGKQRSYPPQGHLLDL